MNYIRYRKKMQRDNIRHYLMMIGCLILSFIIVFIKMIYQCQDNNMRIKLNRYHTSQRNKQRLDLKK